MDLKIQFTPNVSANIQYHYANFINNNKVKQNSGLDIPCPNNHTILPKSYGTKVHLGIKVSAYNNDCRQPFMLALRSSTGLKTPIRLSNHIEIIDVGYNDEICAIVDNYSDELYTIKTGDRLFQIITPSLQPIYSISTVKQQPNTIRNDEGLGSTEI